MRSAGTVAVASLACALTACPSGGRDVLTDSRDVRGSASATDAAAPRRADGYAYVARRPHGAVGLVGAHHMPDDEARRIVDRVADELESCSRVLDETGGLVEGALQLVAVTNTHGNADITDIRFAPGGAVAANALECVVAPLRASPFPAPDGGVPALAIEATWGPLRARRPDAGGSL